MTLITPVGNNSFSWSPKGESLLKTASTGETVEQPDSDKDALFAAAKAVVEAQLAFEEEVIEDEMPAVDGELVEEISDETEKPFGDDEEGAEKMDDDDEAPEASGDVQDAVAELVEKAEKAEEVAEAVTEAWGKVEEAVQDVKSAVGGCEECTEGDLADAFESEEAGGAEEIEIEICPEGECDEEGGIEDEIMQESEGTMKSAASEDSFVAFASLSPTVKKKVYTYYTKYLKYPADYAKLLVTDYE
jgi:hypothetical protein